MVTYTWGRWSLVLIIITLFRNSKKYCVYMNYDILLFFRIMLYKISEDLSTEDLQRLIFYSERVFKLTRKEKQSLSSAFDLFVLLEKRGHLTVLNTKCLKDMIKTKIQFANAKRQKRQLTVNKTLHRLKDWERNAFNIINGGLVLHVMLLTL
jgi:hypothetical protein